MVRKSVYGYVLCIIMCVWISLCAYLHIYMYACASVCMGECVSMYMCVSECEHMPMRVSECVRVCVCETVRFQTLFPRPAASLPHALYSCSQYPLSAVYQCVISSLRDFTSGTPIGRSPGYDAKHFEDTTVLVELLPEQRMTTWLQATSWQ